MIKRNYFMSVFCKKEDGTLVFHSATGQLKSWLPNTTLVYKRLEKKLAEKIGGGELTVMCFSKA